MGMKYISYSKIITHSQLLGFIRLQTQTNEFCLLLQVLEITDRTAHYILAAAAGKILINSK